MRTKPEPKVRMTAGAIVWARYLHYEAFPAKVMTEALAERIGAQRPKKWENSGGVPTELVFVRFFGEGENASFGWCKRENCTKYDPHSAKRKLERGKVNAGMRRAIVLADKDYNTVKGTENDELVRKIREIASNPVGKEDELSEMQWDYFISWQGAVRRGVEIEDLHEDEEENEDGDERDNGISEEISKKPAPKVSSAQQKSSHSEGKKREKAKESTNAVASKKKETTQDNINGDSSSWCWQKVVKKARKSQAKPPDEKLKKAKLEESPSVHLADKSETAQPTPSIALEAKSSVSESKSKISDDKKLTEAKNTVPSPKKKNARDFRSEAILRVLKTLARAPNAFKPESAQKAKAAYLHYHAYITEKRHNELNKSSSRTEESKPSQKEKPEKKKVPRKKPDKIEEDIAEKGTIDKERETSKLGDEEELRIQEELRIREEQLKEKIRKEIEQEMEERKRKEEAMRIEEEAKKTEEAQKIEEEKKIEEAKKIEEEKKIEEAKKIEEEKKIEEAKKIEEEKKIEESEEAKRREHADNRSSKTKRLPQTIFLCFPENVSIPLESAIRSQFVSFGRFGKGPCGSGVIVDRDNHYCSVTFKQGSDAERALKRFQGAKLFGRSDVTLSYQKPTPGSVSSGRSFKRASSTNLPMKPSKRSFNPSYANEEERKGHRLGINRKGLPMRDKDSADNTPNHDRSARHSRNSSTPQQMYPQQARLHSNTNDQSMPRGSNPIELHHPQEAARHGMHSFEGMSPVVDPSTPPVDGFSNLQNILEQARSSPAPQNTTYPSQLGGENAVANNLVGNLGHIFDTVQRQENLGGSSPAEPQQELENLGALINLVKSSEPGANVQLEDQGPQSNSVDISGTLQSLLGALSGQKNKK